MKRRWLVRIAGLLLAVAGIGVALLFVGLAFKISAAPFHTLSLIHI